jgi:hypothetical protein
VAEVNEMRSPTPSLASHTILCLFFGPFLKILFRPQKITARQHAGTKQQEREFSRHTGHGDTLRWNSIAKTKIIRAMEVFVQSVTILYHVLERKTSEICEYSD